MHPGSLEAKHVTMRISALFFCKANAKGMCLVAAPAENPAVSLP